MSDETLTTARLAGRRIGREDVDGIAAMFQDERVTATLGGPRDRDTVEKMVDYWSRHFDEHGFGPYIWHDRETGDFIGWCGLQWTTIARERAIELLYAIVADRFGEGLTTEAAAEVLRLADEEFRIDEIVAFTLTTNRGSQRVMEKNGFVYEREVEHANLPHVLYRRSRSGSVSLPTVSSQ
jgi:[ribosomal protein S5]-alanine N-acetyltransferase